MQQETLLRPSNATRMGANSIPPVLLRVRIMAAAQVHRGNSGTVQDFINFVLLGLSEEKPEVLDKYFDRGEEIWNKMIHGEIAK